MHLSGKFSQHTATNDELLIHSIATSNALQLASVFKEWDQRPPLLQHIATTLTHALTEEMCVDFSAQDLLLMGASARLAAEENNNPYHGNLHFLKVFTMSAFLGAHAYRDGRIDAHKLSLLLTSALIHDYKHDGTHNNGQRYRLENISLNESESTLKPFCATDEDWQLISAFVHTTDVSKNFADPSSLSPSESVKKYSLTHDPHDLLPELYILADTATSDISLMLEDADLGEGLLDAELSKSSGTALAKEQGHEYNIDSQKFFFEHICHRRMFSVSGKQLIQPHMNKVLTSFGLTVTPTLPSPSFIPE